MWNYKEFKVIQNGVICDEGFHIFRNEESPRIETDHDESLAKAITNFLNENFS